MGCSRANHLAVGLEPVRRFGDGQVQHVGHAELVRPPFTSRISARKRRPSPVRAAQVDVAEELHLHMLEALPPPQVGAAPVAGVETELAGGVAALARQRRVGKELGSSRPRRRRSWPGWSARSCRSGSGRRTPHRPASRRRAGGRARPVPRWPCRSAAPAPVQHVPDQRALPEPETPVTTLHQAAAAAGSPKCSSGCARARLPG